MIAFLKSSIMGIIILGAIGSIIGYLLILLYKKLFRSIIILKKNIKQLRFEEFKRKYINDYVEMKILTDDKMPNSIILTKLLIDFSFNLGVLIICWFIFIQLLIFSVNSTSVYIKVVAFSIGFIQSFPSFKLGEIRGGYKVIYQAFIDKKALEIGKEDLENRASEKYNSKK